MEFLMPPLVLLLIFVVPLWIVMHYRAKRHAGDALTGNDRAELERLAKVAASMRRRIETLEEILDAQTPDWRRRAADTLPKPDDNGDER